uniref:Uncharacterized protein LOC100183310 n=1 Tax=Phallusia mammillata TaxID=59560 RepID=A0A6F9DHA0_9ASCI|nr:uncharacterized protein LOC100183310 [Phallusia mammillata]
MRILKVLLLLTVASYGSCCPRVCRCESRRKVVYCHERDLQYIPYGIPSDTVELRLQGNRIINSPSSMHNLRHLRHLRKLDLHRNKLTSFPKTLPRSLEQIDLNSNEIRFIGRDAFKFLTNLRELNLDHNDITNDGLSPTAFQNATLLETLTMNGNSLTSFPEMLPNTLRHFQVKKNQIETVSSQSTLRLGKLVTLDLSENVISDGVESGALGFLQSLTSLNLRDNELRHIPSVLPENLEELVLSRNSLRYLRRTSLNLGLQSVDLSFNQLESVEPGALDNLPKLLRIELQGNPWRCDCYLTYLKKWLHSIRPILSSESNVRCSTPAKFSGVTLRAMDVESLVCDVTEGSAFELLNATSMSFEFLFHGFRHSDPEYVSYFAFYGVLECRNCSLRDVVASQSALSVMELASEQRLETLNMVNGLQPESTYVICARTSQQSMNDVTIKSCTSFRSTEAKISGVSVVSGNRGTIPTWGIACIGVLIFGIVVVVMLLLLWRRYTNQSKLSRRRYSTHYSKASIVSRSMDNLHQVQIRQFNGRSFHQRTASTTTLDARKEFDVTIMVRGQDATTSPPSLDSAMGASSACATCSLNRNSDVMIARHEDLRHSWYSAHCATDLDDTGVYV